MTEVLDGRRTNGAQGGPPDQPQPDGADVTGVLESGAPEIRIRRIGPDDGAHLRQVRLDAIADNPGDFTTRRDDAEARPAQAWERVAAAHSAADDQSTWFAEVGADTAGMVSAFRTDDGAVTMTSLWSAPGFRRIGVADALVAAVCDWARSHGAVELRQWLVERNEHARAFHGALGFVPTGVERPYEPEPILREVELRLPLL